VVAEKEGKEATMAGTRRKRGRRGGGWDDYYYYFKVNKYISVSIHCCMT
jgi:hypothetical protein